MHRIFLILLTLAPGTLWAQHPRTIPLYSDSIPNSRPTADREHAEINGDGVLVISKISRPTLTIYAAVGRGLGQAAGKIVAGVSGKTVADVAGMARSAAVVICPGGGYWVEAIDLEGSEIARRFAAAGVTAILLKYRLPSDETMVDHSIGALQDAQQAIKVVREHAGKWGIDPNRIGIMGFSAGGHLAAMEATGFDKVLIPDAEQTSVRPDFLILGYPVINCADTSRHMGSCEMLIGKRPTTEQQRVFSAQLRVTDSTPPAFLVHASDDTGVPPDNSILFYEALLRHHVPAELHLYEHGGHGFGMHLKQTNEDWMGRCLHWMEGNGWVQKTMDKK